MHQTLLILTLTGPWLLNIILHKCGIICRNVNNPRGWSLLSEFEGFDLTCTRANFSVLTVKWFAVLHSMQYVCIVYRSHALYNYILYYIKGDLENYQ